MNTASLKEPLSATPLPAISKAVPWSGEVLTFANPAVKLTPLIFVGEEVGIDNDWFKLILAYDGIFFILSMLGFELLMDR